MSFLYICFNFHSFNQIRPIFNMPFNPLLPTIKSYFLRIFFTYKEPYQTVWLGIDRMFFIFHQIILNPGYTFVSKESEGYFFVLGKLVYVSFILILFLRFFFHYLFHFFGYSSPKPIHEFIINL